MTPPAQQCEPKALVVATAGIVRTCCVPIFRCLGAAAKLDSGSLERSRHEGRRRLARVSSETAIQNPRQLSDTVEYLGWSCVLGPVLSCAVLSCPVLSCDDLRCGKNT